jgi:hypothetical protein
VCSDPQCFGEARLHPEFRHHRACASVVVAQAHAEVLELHRRTQSIAEPHGIPQAQAALVVELISEAVGTHPQRAPAHRHHRGEALLAQFAAEEVLLVHQPDHGALKCSHAGRVEPNAPQVGEGEARIAEACGPRAQGQVFPAGMQCAGGEQDQEQEGASHRPESRAWA